MSIVLVEEMVKEGVSVRLREEGESHCVYDVNNEYMLQAYALENAMKSKYQEQLEKKDQEIAELNARLEKQGVCLLVLPFVVLMIKD